MRARCPGALALGEGVLNDHAFVVGPEGWVTVKPARGSRVHGALWQLTLRDLAVLHAYEWLHKGLYDIRTLPVRTGSRSVSALVYRLRRRCGGRAQPGYMQGIVAAAREWHFPDRYVAGLERLIP